MEHIHMFDHGIRKSSKITVLEECHVWHPYVLNEHSEWMGRFTLAGIHESYKTWGVGSTAIVVDVANNHIMVCQSSAHGEAQPSEDQQPYVIKRDDFTKFAHCMPMSCRRSFNAEAYKMKSALACLVAPSEWARRMQIAVELSAVLVRTPETAAK